LRRVVAALRRSRLTVAKGASVTDVDQLWDRIEAMDFGIHEQLEDLRIAMRRELAELQRENDALYRQLAARAEVNASTEARSSDS
jgi:hypothetical protein